FGMLLAACGGGSESSSNGGSGGTGDGGSGGSQTTPAAGGDTTPTETSDDGGSPSGDGEVPEQVVIMQGVDANTLDPMLRNATPEFNINLHIFDMFTRRNPETLKIEPHLVTEWKTIDDL